ncbi:MAG: hypothetical protein AB7F51_10595 [Pseudorhodoplanes sp.]
MTKLLEKAFEKARALSDEEQDVLGAILLTMADNAAGAIPPLDDETRLAIREGLAQARRGDMVSAEDMRALWKRHGL